jgi:integrase
MPTDYAASQDALEALMRRCDEDAASAHKPARSRRRRSEHIAFTERALAALERPTSGSRYVYDTVEAGLGVRLTPTRSRYVFYRWHHGKPDRLTLPEVGSVSLRDVRRIVAGLRGDLARGIDVFARARQEKHPTDVATLQDAFEAHLKRADLRNNTRRDYASAWRNVPARLAAKSVNDVMAADLERLHASIGDEGHRRLANKLIVLIATLLRRNGRRGDNPAAGIARFREEPRQRVLSLDELHRLREAFGVEEEPWRSYFLLLMLTGARRSALAQMRWEDVDLDLGTWRIPATKSKNRKTLAVALPSEAVELLRRRRNERGASDWVFPAASQSGHLMSPKQAWRRICRRAGIEGAMVHDLRRTLGTMVAADGAGAAIVSAVLGHASQQSARSYVHLSAAVGRDYVERAARRTSRAA